MSVRPLVQDFMTRKTIHSHPESSILDIRNLMVRHRISRIIIVEGGKPVGIVTQRDLLRFMLENPGKTMDEVKAVEVMSRRLVTAKPVDTVGYVARLMISNGISSVVIVGDQGTLEGIVTKFDLCVCYMERFVGFSKVGKYMTPNPVTVKPTLNVFEVINIMSSKGIGRVIVVEGVKPIGIITLSDLVFAMPEALGIKTGVRGRFRRIEIPRIGLLIASDVMTLNPITIHEDEDLAEASRLIVKLNISGLPVVNGESLKGIITKTDIVRAIAETVVST